MTRSAIGAVLLCAAVAVSAAMPSGQSCCVADQCFCPTRRCARPARPGQIRQADPAPTGPACRCCPPKAEAPDRGDPPPRGDGRDRCPRTNCPLLSGAHQDRFPTDRQTEIRPGPLHGPAVTAMIPSPPWTDPLAPAGRARAAAGRFPPWPAGGLLALHCSLLL